MPYYPPSTAGVTDHGALTGLTDDDHTQYQKETDFTSGSVLFRGSSAIDQDNTNLFWDNTSKLLGVGTNVPGYALEVHGAGVTVRRGQDAASAPLLRIYKGRGTDQVANLKRTLSADTIGGVNALTAEKTDNLAGATWITSAAGSFQFRAAEDQTPTGHGANFVLSLCDIGATTATQKLSVIGGLMAVGSGTATSKLHVEGPIATAIATKTTTYTVLATDSIILGNHATVAFTITLPTAVGCAGRMYTFKNINAAAVTIDGNASETIDGATTYALATLNKYVVIVSDNANWKVVANN